VKFDILGIFKCLKDLLKSIGIIIQKTFCTVTPISLAKFLCAKNSALLDTCNNQKKYNDATYLDQIHLTK
jgi:hypothetical protein